MEKAYFQLCYGSNGPEEEPAKQPFINSTTAPPALDNCFREQVNHRPQARQMPAKTRASDTASEDEWGWGWISKMRELWEDCISVTVHLRDAARCDQYTTPGMYVKMRPFGSDQQLFLAMVNSPHQHRQDGHLEFIVKKSPSSAWLWNARIGHEVQLTQALGKGFQTTHLQKNVDTIMLLAAGTGIAPINAVIDEYAYRWKAQGKTLRLYFGCEGMEEFQLLDQADNWRKAGVVVTPCVSKRCEANKAAGWEGFVCGHVQNAAAKHAREGLVNGPRTAVLMCGPKSMMDSARRELRELGVPADHFLTNY